MAKFSGFSGILKLERLTLPNALKKQHFYACLRCLADAGHLRTLVLRKCRLASEDLRDTVAECVAQGLLATAVQTFNGMPIALWKQRAVERLDQPPQPTSSLLHELKAGEQYS